MSHQKTKRIESPLKGMVHSMLLQNHQTNIFSSRITQKRKPIFDQNIPRSSVSRSNSVRKKIFSQTQKSQEKESTLRFSKLFQTEQLSKRTGEDINSHEFQQPQINDSIQSSSIEEDSGLGDVKRQLFPATPIKRISRQIENLQNGRQWLTNSSKNYNKQLFEDEYSPSKTNHSITTNNVEKTIFKFSYNTPEKIKQKPIEEKSKFQRTELNSEYRPSSFIRNLNLELQSKRQPSGKKPETDIAKQLRDLHSKMLQKAKVFSNVDEKNLVLKEENQRLREQNRMLKSQQLRLSIRPEDQPRNERLQNQELKKIANQSIFVKVKVEKARNMINNLINLSEAQSLPTNSIINLQQTLKQVLKELEL